MKKDPKISIITCIYNGEKYVSCLFDSVLEQEYQNIQHIVVNDGSTDNTLKILHKYKEIYINNGMSLIIINQKNMGLGGATNVALKYIEGEYWTWINCDDWYKKNAFKTIVRYLKSHPSLDVVHFNYQYWIEDGNGKLFPTNRNGLYYSSKNIYRNSKSLQKRFYLEDHFSYLLYFVKTQSYRKINPKMEIDQFKGTQDCQLAAQLYPNLKISLLDKELMVFRGRNDSWLKIGGFQGKNDYIFAMMHSVELLNIDERKKRIINELIRLGPQYTFIKNDILKYFARRDRANCRQSIKELRALKKQSPHCTRYLSHDWKIDTIIFLSSFVVLWKLSKLTKKHSKLENQHIKKFH